MHPVWALGTAGLLAALLLISTFEPRFRALYTDLYDLHWPCDPSMPMVLPLALPSSRWNVYGKVLGTVVSTAVTYRVSVVGSDILDLDLGQTHQRCPENAECSIAYEYGWNVNPTTTLHRVVGRASRVIIPVPAASNNVSLAHWTGIKILRFISPSQAAHVPRQLWSLVVDDMPDLTSFDSSTADSDAVVDVRGSLNTVRLTPRVPLGRTLVTRTGTPLIRASNLEFALVQPVCMSGRALVGVEGNVTYLGRVGGSRSCTTYLLSVSGRVTHCIDMATAQQLCHDCSLNTCLSSAA